jgi:hypothetical protein
VEADRIFCALALRAVATKDSIFTLCEAGHGEAAVALTRVLLENASLMAWQRLGPGRERLETYVLFSSVLRKQTIENRERFYQEFGWSSDEAKAAAAPDPYHEAIAESVFRGHEDTWAYFPDPDNPRKLKRVGMRQMLEDLTEKERPFEYEVMYRMGNDQIHTSPFGVAYLLSHVKANKVFFLDVLHARDSRLVALEVSNVLMLVVLQTMDQYAGLGLEANIEDIHVATKALSARMPREFA